MIRHRLAAAALLLALPAGSVAAQPDLPPPTPLFPGAQSGLVEQQELPPMTPPSPSALAQTTLPRTAAPPITPPEPAPPAPPPPGPMLSAPTEPPPGVLSPPPIPPAPAGPAAQRILCDQAVAVQIAERAAIPEAYRGFIGIWSDAAWTPQLCAALIVQNVQPDGTASIIYAYGPMGSRTRSAGGVLFGMGIIRDGELRFQNNDGSQFAFQPLYADLSGRLITPQGQRYAAVFKKNF
jgi:hypothetical protein